MFLQLKISRSLLLLAALVLISPLDSLLNSHFIAAAFAESEASSEAASEAPMTGGRRRGGYWRYQMQQQRAAAQQARKQQQTQNQQQKRQNIQRNKPFKVSDYIHEYGSGRSKHNFNRQNLAGANSGNSSGSPLPVGTPGGGGSSAGSLPSTSSVPFQKFPPK